MTISFLHCSYVLFQVTVSITDENDLPPKFQFLNYGGEVKENVPIGTNVVTLTATDPDLSNKTKVSLAPEI